jgi:hypothetical protein
MKKVVFLIIILGFSFKFTQAQSSLYVNEKVSIKSNSDLNFILNAHADKNKNGALSLGYRIQILNTSNRDEVYAKKAEVFLKFSEQKAYIIYDQPYYKLKFGDFKTKLEARKFLEEIITVFPNAFIVRDDIKNY